MLGLNVMLWSQKSVLKKKIVLKGEIDLFLFVKSQKILYP